MLNTCFLELLIKICHAVINSFKNVTGSNPCQGKRETDSFPFQWITALGKDTDSSENSSVICSGRKYCRVYAVVFKNLHLITFALCSPVYVPEINSELDL